MRKSRRRLIRLFKAGAAICAGTLAIPAAWVLNRPARDALEIAIGQMLMFGFYGNNTRSISARLLAAQLRSGRAAGVFFVLQNIGSREEVATLINLFRMNGARASGQNPFLAIDHEGGVVQRLGAAHGFTPLPCPRDIAATLTPAQATAIYAQAGAELACLGFNLNLGPVVDIDAPGNPAISHFGRSFGADPEQIAAFASAFVNGFTQAGILCAAKHFPGHGNARSDSHDGTADVSGLWSEVELNPYASLFAQGRPDMVMGGHLRLRELDPSGAPATLSRAIITDVLRYKLRFPGVIVTDDLDMGAVSGTVTRHEAVIRAIAAGNDMLFIKNLFGYDPSLPRRVVTWVRAAIAEGTLTEQQIFDSARRIRLMRQQIRR